MEASFLFIPNPVPCVDQRIADHRYNAAVKFLKRVAFDCVVKEPRDLRVPLVQPDLQRMITKVSVKRVVSIALYVSQRATTRIHGERAEQHSMARQRVMGVRLRQNKTVPALCSPAQRPQAADNKRSRASGSFS